MRHGKLEANIGGEYQKANNKAPWDLVPTMPMYPLQPKQCNYKWDRQG